MQLVAAYRWAAMWPELTATVQQAVDVADRMGDPVRAAQAAISTTQGALWQSAPHGAVHEGIVSALRRSLEALPAEDSRLRCRCMLSLANELYYAVSFAERRALVAEALAMAERIGDPALLVDANQIAFVSLWSAVTAEERLGYAERALALCRETGAQQPAGVSATLRAVALSELGRPREMWAAYAEARAECERLRLPYGLLVLDTLVIAWEAMAGRFDRCEELMASVVELSRQVSLKHSEDAVAGAAITVGRWRGRAGDYVPMLQQMEGGTFEITATVISFLWAAGREEEAAAYAAANPVRLEHDDWFSALAWCNAAEAALYLGAPDLAAGAYARLAPLAGHCGSAGSGNACGPVDAYLALAAAAVGETTLATRHADAAERLCAEWDIPLCAQWLRTQRERYRF
jgi:hypothetical protein